MEDKFYDGFCKTILWPLFHSSMPTTEDTIASHDADSIEEQREEGQLWLAYKASSRCKSSSTPFIVALPLFHLGCWLLCPPR